jgi:hypothetical protein
MASTQNCQYPSKIKHPFVSICDPRMLRIYLAKNATFKICHLWLRHQTKQFHMQLESMDNLLNKDNFPLTSA